jgi:hypothetical protein
VAACAFVQFGNAYVGVNTSSLAKKRTSCLMFLNPKIALHICMRVRSCVYIVQSCMCVRKVSKRTENCFGEYACDGKEPNDLSLKAPGETNCARAEFSWSHAIR